MNLVIKSILPMAFIGMLAGVNAAELSLKPSYKVGIFHNDNVRLEKDENANDISGILADISLDMTRQTENSGLFAVLRNRSTFHDEDSFDSNDQFLNVGYRVFSERGSYTVNAGYVRDTTRTLEIGNTGEVGNERRELYSLLSNLSYGINEKTLVDIRASFQKQSYGNNSAGLIGYDNLGVSSTLYYSFTERLKFLLRPSFSKFEGGERQAVGVVYKPVFPFYNVRPLEYNLESDVYGLLTGIDYKFNEQLSGDISVGRSIRKSENVLSSSSKNFCSNNEFVYDLTNNLNQLCYGGESKTAITSYDLNLQWKKERSSLLATAGVEFSPASGGVLSKLNRFKVTYYLSITERFKLNTMLGVYERSYERSLINRNLDKIETTDTNFKVGVDYRMLEKLLVSVNYDFYQRDSNSLDKKLDRNLISLGLSYRPAKTIW